jgi:hypothetical protein
MSAERTVLVVIRTIATASWLLDILPELVGDPRVQVLFTIDDNTSAFDDGVLDVLRQVRGKLVPWSQAVETEFDLAISASHNGSLERLRSPLLLTSHGIGFTKTQTVPEGGIPPLPRSRAGHAPRTTVVLSHSEQRRQWGRSASGEFRTEVVGDPWLDRLNASLRQRDRYRAALGVRTGQRLIVVSSTWRRHSLLAVHPELPARLLAELPLDEYRVAAVLHPNIWSGHGDWQVRTWLREATDAGLVLLPPFGGWRSALVAADCLIGDHGSVTFYAAAIGTPVLLGAYGMAEVAAETPMEDFGRRAPFLDLRRCRAQLESLSFERDPGRYADLVARSFANPGLALRTLRDLIYRLIELQPPARQPQVRPLPAPDPHRQDVTAHVVLASRASDGVVELRRHPAVMEPETGFASELRHLVVDDGEPDQRLRESAAVHVRRAFPWSPPGGEREDAAAWVGAALADYPGLRLAVAALPDQRLLIGVRDGPLVEATIEGATDDAVGLGASAVYAAVTAGWREAHLEPGISLRAGPSALRIIVGG